MIRRVVKRTNASNAPKRIYRESRTPIRRSRRYFRESIDDSISIDISGIIVEVDKDYDTCVDFESGDTKSHIISGRNIISYEGEEQDNVFCYIELALAEALCRYIDKNYPDISAGADTGKHGYFYFSSGTVTLDVPDGAAGDETYFYDVRSGDISYKLSGVRLSKAEISEDWQYDRQSSYVTYEY